MQSTIDRFLDKVIPEPNSGCWLWVGPDDGRVDSYGKFRIEDKFFGAHVAGYLLLVGPVPEGLELDHLCRVKCCVNPHHLEPVTRLVNTQRALPHRKRPTHCPQGHEYTPENTIKTRPCASYKYEGRQCRTCHSAYARSWEAKKKLKRLSEGNKP
jgi:hypothetical protein